LIYRVYSEIDNSGSFVEFYASDWFSTKEAAEEFMSKVDWNEPEIRERYVADKCPEVIEDNDAYEEGKNKPLPTLIARRERDERVSDTIQRRDGTRHTRRAQDSDAASD
jgi:hypothetical protein